MNNKRLALEKTIRHLRALPYSKKRLDLLRYLEQRLRYLNAIWLKEFRSKLKEDK